MSSVSIKDNMKQYYWNFYFGPVELYHNGGIPKVAMQLPHKYLDFDNTTIRIGLYSDYLWSRQERLKYKKERI